MTTSQTNISSPELAPTDRYLARGSATKAKIGLFGIGLAAYWPQFPGLLERLTGYQRDLETRIQSCGGRIVTGGMVDTPQKAREAGELFARSDLDLVFCYVATYAT